MPAQDVGADPRRRPNIVDELRGPVRHRTHDLDPRRAVADHGYLLALPRVRLVPCGAVDEFPLEVLEARDVGGEFPAV